MNGYWSVWLLILVCLAGGPAWAVDHNNLDESRPLRLEDAYPIAYGELSVETGARFSLNRQNPDRVAFPMELLYGAYWNLQLGLGSTLATEPRTIDEAEKSGDLRTFVLYNFNQETLRLPAFAVKVSVDFPTGMHSQGVDTELKGILTRSFGQIRTHLNAGYEFIGNAADGERNGRYELVLGAQYPVRYRHFLNTTVLADVFTQQAVHIGESNPTGVEIGIRKQVAPLTVLDVGVGTEFAGPAERTLFFAMVGVSVGF